MFYPKVSATKKENLKPLLTANETAKELGINPTTIHKYQNELRAENAVVEATGPGPSYYIKRSELEIVGKICKKNKRIVSLEG